MARRSDVRISVCAREFITSKTSGTALLPTQPPEMDTGDFARRYNEVNHSPLSAEVSNEWSYISAPQICLNGVERGINLPALYKTRNSKTNS